MPTVITQGAASAKGYGFGARATAANYIEDVFSTYLYTGTRATLNIVNGVDLSTKGGMVWCKERNTVSDHCIFDTARGINLGLSSNTTTGSSTWTGSLTAFNTNGFTLGGYAPPNSTGAAGCSWTFRKQAKFFDVVTYTGTGANRTIAHNLGSVPGCIIVKRTDTTAAWAVYHRSLANTQYAVLNTTAAAATGATYWNSTTPTSSVFSLGTSTDVNASGGTYVAYLFAHDAGGFGATGTDNVISCGSYTGNGSATGPTITLGYEPQWVLIKQTTNAGTRWTVTDNMRGFPVTSSAAQQILQPNTADTDIGVMYIQPTSTGFKVVDVDADVNTNGSTYIYIAIRRGPMKTPTTGTSVFSPITATDTEGQGTVKTTNFPVDLQIPKATGGGQSWVVDRLRGISSNTTDSAKTLTANSTDAESTAFAITRYWNNTGYQISSAIGNSASVYWNFRRAPGFFDVVCYTGTSANRTVSHNLGVAPELMIVKPRSLAGENWIVYCSLLNTPEQNRLVLNGTFGQLTTPNATWWNSTNPTSSVFSLGTPIGVNASGYTYVNYLFASVAGVSKVGSYTGTGTTKQIDCGFTGGARFVLIKRTDSTGDWYVWDSARGIVAGNDSYLLLNSTAAEVTNTDYVDTYSAGFEISSTAPAAINANGGTFIFWAVA